MERGALASRNTILLGLVAMSSACASFHTEVVAPELTPGVQREEQLSSLRYLYYRNTPAPPPPTETELAGIEGVLEPAPEDERDYLEEYYKNARDLLVFATRDSDGDGVHDYRVSDYYGKFLEGDIDVDGDGVRNVYDSSPYDPAVGGADTDADGVPDEPGSFQDANDNGIPDHLDWRLQGKVPEAASQQEALFRDHEIILVERSAEFTEDLARSVYDAVARIFRGPFTTRAVLPTLRTIATEETCLLTPEVDDGTNAMVIVQTQSLVIYRIGIDYPSFVQLGLVAHELGHNYQLSLDFDQHDLAAENERVYYPAPRFHALVEPFGWEAQPVVFDPAADGYQSFTPQYYDVSPFYTWLGDTTEEWAAWLERKYSREGDDYLEDPEVLEHHIVGDYSLSNPWEWYSDNMIAYTFLEIERRLREMLDGDELDAALQAMDAASREAWPSFRYQNLDRDAVEQHFRKTFPLREQDLGHFVVEYVKPLALADESASAQVRVSRPDD